MHVGGGGRFSKLVFGTQRRLINPGFGEAFYGAGRSASPSTCREPPPCRARFESPAGEIRTHTAEVPSPSVSLGSVASGHTSCWKTATSPLNQSPAKGRTQGPPGEAGTWGARLTLGR